MAEDSEKTCEYLKTKATTEPIASFLGTTLAELRPGYSRVTMTVREEFLNFNDVVFGGIIMSLADQAFAYGSNSLSHPNV